MQLSKIAFYATREDATKQENRILCDEVDNNTGKTKDTEKPSNANLELNNGAKWADLTMKNCGGPNAIEPKVTRI